MQAFLLERLYPTGWRRTGELFWRRSDAEHESTRALHERKVRGVRVLAAHINPVAVIEVLADSMREGGSDK
jgi:hypothetical protein